MIAIVDYGAGNLVSVKKAFDWLGKECAITSDPAEVAKAAKIVLPGVGHFASTAALGRSGLQDAIADAIERKVPFLGICVGMQLMAERGLEFRITPGFGWIKGDVKAIEPSDPTLKIPHMGWNTLAAQGGQASHKLLDGIPLGPDGLHAYFVHSYQLRPQDGSDLVAEADYGGPITAIVARGNVAGTQFHPEKSQKLGLALIANFLKWKP